MHANFASVTLVACMISGALSTPLAKTNQQVKINQVQRGKVWRSGPVSLLQTYQKFGKTAPQAVVEAAARAKKAKTSVGANPVPSNYDDYYLTPFTVGNDTLNMQVDTGSSDFWVFSTLQPSSQTSGHSLYSPTGQQESGESWSITYGDGSGASGVVYPDTVVVGSATATGQAVEAATSVSSDIVDTESDGIAGFGFDSINQCSPDACPTLFQTLAPTLAKPLFTSALKKGAPGAYTLGYIDSSLKSGPITYVPVDSSRGYWGFSPGAYSFGTSKTYSGNIDAGSFPIVDTGTSLLLLDQSIVTQYYSQVSGSSFNSQQQGYTYPCANAINFNVVIGGKAFTIPATNMNYAQIDSTDCFGGLQANTGIGINIFGDIFIKSVYIVFQPQVPNIGFAKPAS